MNYLTVKRLQEVIHYDKETGVFTWKVNLGSKAKAGNVAGYRSKSPGQRTSYRKITIDTIKYEAHRLAWLYVYGKFPERHIDHIDRDGLNNRIDNLRDVTEAVNAKNKRLQKNNKSGVTGVFKNRNSRKWIAVIFTNKKHIQCGRFTSFDDAVKARKAAERKYGFHENHGTATAGMGEK